MIESKEISRLYLEVGALGVAFIITIFILVALFKYFLSNLKNYNTLIEKMLVDENKKNQELYEDMISRITLHVPSEEENKKLSKLQIVIDKELKSLLVELKASRVALVRYHNGSHDLNKHSFLKMSVTNEQYQVEEEPLMTVFKDQFRSLFSEAIPLVERNGEFSVENIENLKDIDSSMYCFMKNRGDVQAFHYAVHNCDGMVVGYLVVIYSVRTTERNTKEVIIPKMRQVTNVIERLMEI